MFNITVWNGTNGNNSLLLIPSSWLKDPLSAGQTSVVLLFGKHWSHTALPQSDLWQQLPLCSAAGTWLGRALAVPHQVSCTSPERIPVEQNNCMPSVAPQTPNNTVWQVPNLSKVNKLTGLALVKATPEKAYLSTTRVMPCSSFFFIIGLWVSMKNFTINTGKSLQSQKVHS